MPVKKFKVQSLKFKIGGFTLIELLVVIAIIAILTAIGLVIFTQVNARARDGRRIADLTNLKNAITYALQDATDSAVTLCSTNPTPCQGATFPLNSSTRNTDGTGWIKVNFDAHNTANLNVLPVDPTNNSTYFLNYYSDGTNWKIKAVLESQEYRNLMQNDGGSDANAYEVGTNLKSLP